MILKMNRECAEYTLKHREDGNNAHKCDGCEYAGHFTEMGFERTGVCAMELTLDNAEKAYNAEVCPHAKITESGAMEYR